MESSGFVEDPADRLTLPLTWAVKVTALGSVSRFCTLGSVLMWASSMISTDSSVPRLELNCWTAVLLLWVLPVLWLAKVRVCWLWCGLVLMFWMLLNV